MVNKSLQVKDRDLMAYHKLLTEYGVFLNTIRLEVPVLVELAEQPHYKYWE